jgi:bifunctional UDP-N-acetylglucosamine pyrophosphorylase/glucosamine-1-phosphate N-acetyltransferase
MLHPLAGRPLVLHALGVAQTVTNQRPIAVISPDQPELAQALQPHADIAIQHQARGTGDALNSVEPAQRPATGPILVLSGDVPLLRPATLARLLAHHTATRAAATLLTVVPPNPKGLGRIQRDPRTRKVVAITEERDLPPGAADAHRECNAGVYVFDAEALWPALDRLTPDNAQGEYYLTDVIALIDGDVEALEAEDATETLGVNDRVQLAEAGAEIRRRTLESLMLDGVTVEDPATTYVEPQVRIGRDTTLKPMTSISGGTTLGERCVIGPMATLIDVRSGDGVHIGPSYIEDCALGDDVHVGAYVRIRPGTTLERGVMLGTHAEVKNSHLGPNTKVSHFSAVLDSDVGEDVNIGAGTVTVNYDGIAKHRTVIGDRAFIGSDSLLVAPRRIGDDAFVAAGSVITHDVPDGALAVERAEQRNVEGWSARRRGRAQAVEHTTE